MPTLWRYLLRSYFQVFFLCVSGFIAVLLVTRFQEIARLAALNPNLGKIFLFTLFQIPYILPIAFPISGLIAAILLLQRLSHTHELTALRASGIGISALRTPLLMTAFVLSLINFAFVAEVTPRCRFHSYTLLHDAATINPLFLMKKSKMLNLQDSYVDMKMTHLGKEAKDVLFVVKNASSDRLSLMSAKKFSVDDNLMTGKSVALISTIPEEDGFDSLVIENQETMSTSASALSSIMQKRTHKIGFEHLPLGALISSFSDHTARPKTVKRAQFELYRRIFSPCATFAFTFLGFSLGMQIGRERKRKGIYLAILLSAMTFISAAAAKSFQLFPLKVMICYGLPFPILFAVSLYFQKRIARGIE